MALMYLKRLELSGFKSFARKSELDFSVPITAVVGPNGSGKSNIAEAFRFVLGEQSMKSMRTKRGEDLIFNGSREAGRMNRASVTVVFDNQKHVFPVDYEEVLLTREVHRDGTNRYLINGTQVRLKDVLELLASARIGSSHHHIISQGEADRVLSVNDLERRAMIEDALGLRIYQMKKLESERKLEKTEENLEQVQTLERETLPHLKFLERQVKKIEKARELREELVEVSKEYFCREELYLEAGKKELNEEKEREEEVLHGLDHEIARLKESAKDDEGGGSQHKAFALEEQMRGLQAQKEDVTRKLGRIEGVIENEERRYEERKRKIEEGEGEKVMISYKRISDFYTEFQDGVNDLFHEDDIAKVKEGIRGALSHFRAFLEKFKHQPGETRELGEESSENLENLTKEQKELAERLEEIVSSEKAQQEELQTLREQEKKERQQNQGTQEVVFEKMTKRSECAGRLSRLSDKLESLARDRRIFESDLTEFAHVIGKGILSYRDVSFDQAEAASENREGQQERRRSLERKKIKVEEMGGSGEEILSEYKTLKERHEFFERETEDLRKSKAGLEELIEGLEDQLDQEFKEGLKKINTQFQNFFSTIFDGGKATLGLVKEKSTVDLESASLGSGETEPGETSLDKEEGEKKKAKRGLEINLSLPKKRIRGLQMLSGGERSLTSVALLFAISQVNPPPFLILDETDAALDESNSRRYAEMLETLSEKTQLIVITHNRETMSKAGALYGITVGPDAISKVLSVKFEEASEAAAR